MEPAHAGSLLTYLSQVPDPRGRQGRRYSLSAMLTTVVCSLLCGARGYEGVVEWLHDLPVDIWHWMGFTRRPPRKEAFRDLLIKLDPAELDRVLQQWVVTDLGLPDETKTLVGISIDGKCLCVTVSPSAKAVHLLAAVDHQTGYVLSQTRVDEKTNEHKGALELLKNLVLKGRVVVGEAMFCQREVCDQVLDAEGDYLIAVKGNQPNLQRKIELEFTAAPAAVSPHAQQQRAAEQQTAHTVDQGHGRLEKRTMTTTTSLNNHVKWPGVKQVCRVVRERTKHGQREVETAYDLSSLSRDRANAAPLLALVHDHWGAIENGVHHVRDTTFEEDRCTIFRGHAPQNLAALRNTALNWNRRMKTVNLAATTRSFTRQSLRLFTKLDFVN